MMVFVVLFSPGCSQETELLGVVRGSREAVAAHVERLAGVSGRWFDDGSFSAERGPRPTFGDCWAAEPVEIVDLD